MDKAVNLFVAQEHSCDPFHELFFADDSGLASYDQATINISS